MHPVAGLPGPENGFQRLAAVGTGGSGWPSQIEAQAASKRHRGEFAGDNTFVLFGFRAIAGSGGIWTARKAKFAVGSVDAEALPKLELLASLASLRQGADRLSGSEVGGGFKLASCIAQQAALQCDGLSSKAGEVESNAFGRGGSATTAADWPATEDHMRCRARNFGLPPGFFVAGELSHLREMVAELGVPGCELGQQFMTNAIAREGEMSVGGVFTPGLFERMKKGFNLGSRCVKQRSDDFAAIRAFEYWMNSR
jgi:hypothetical protein